jgi:oligopeptide transport system substrate-binding protein
MGDSLNRQTSIQEPPATLRNVFLAGLAVLALAGCGQSGPSRPPCPEGKVCLMYGNGTEPATLDPHTSTGVWEDRIQSDLFMGLTQSAADGSTMPGVAERWEVSADGLTWTFHLRESYWSDGVPVTADDFVFSLRRVLDPKTASEYASLIFIIKGGQAINEGKAPLESLGVRALDPRTLQIELNNPAAFLPELTKHHILYPVPKHVVEREGPSWVRPGKMVSNGPYMLVDWKLGDHLKTVKNPRFFEADKVCVDEVRFYPTSDAISAERRVASGELDLNTDMQSNRIAFLREKMPGYVRTNTYLGVTYLAFNNGPKSGYPPFRDRRVRQALAMSIDRDFITEKLFRGGQSPALTMVPPGVAAEGRDQAPQLTRSHALHARRPGRLEDDRGGGHAGAAGNPDRLRRLPRPRLPGRRRGVGRRLQRRHQLPGPATILVWPPELRRLQQSRVRRPDGTGRQRARPRQASRLHGPGRATDARGRPDRAGLLSDQQESGQSEDHRLGR